MTILAIDSSGLVASTALAMKPNATIFVLFIMCRQFTCYSICKDMKSY